MGVSQMKIALLQEERYLPNYIGGNKCTRALLEGLAGLGHDCLALCPVRLSAVSIENFREDMRGRSIEVAETGPNRDTYEHRGVRVVGLPPALHERHRFLTGRISDFGPDVVLVSGDPRYYLLASALAAAPGRVVFIVHSHEHVPFGPFSRRTEQRQAGLLERASAVVAVSRYSQDYLLRHGGLESVCLPFPVYGDGPFPQLGNFDGGFVTLINAEVGKGVHLFMELARNFPRHEFAVVRWGAAAETLAALESLANVRNLEPVDDIEDVLRLTKILVMPSLVPETFGLTSVEAMVRGIPTVTSNLGGLPEAKAGVDFLLPVRPAEVRDGEFIAPPQNLVPWVDALNLLLNDRETYEKCAAESRTAAGRFVSSLSVRPFEDLFFDVASSRHSKNGADTAPVAVVDPFDAGFLLAEELKRRGYPCISVVSSEHVSEEILAKCDRGAFLEVIQHNEDLEKTQSELRRLGVRCVLSGCETGVMTADVLSESMGFRTNGAALSQARRNKFLMAEAVRRAGLRVPAQFLSDRWDELLDWVKGQGKWPVVVKPPHSLASEDVRVCRSEDELEQAFHSLLHRRNISGLVNHAVLAQELIFGTQYVLDTVSHEGSHYLAGVWRYGRPEFASSVLSAAEGGGDWPGSLAHVSWDEINYGAIGSNSKTILPGDDDLAEALFAYASRALDALGIRYGPAHFELMWIDDGPVLVEVGARLHGAPSTHWMCRICTGASQLDQTIDSYLNPGHFLRVARRSYALRWHGAKVRLHPWRGGFYKCCRGLDRIESLPSFRGFFYMSEPKELTPLDCVGVVALIHADEEAVRRDFQFIRELEKQDLFDIDPQPALAASV